jgi:hypothetical protein
LRRLVVSKGANVRSGEEHGMNKRIVIVGGGFGGAATAVRGLIALRRVPEQHF